ncbi:ATP-binding cassette domain-containing protein [Streptomyces arenae]|nr:ATP-binding cassette domain-containing protein [Streptomyces arenae]
MPHSPCGTPAHSGRSPTGRLPPHGLRGRGGMCARSTERALAPLDLRRDAGTASTHIPPRPRPTDGQRAPRPKAPRQAPTHPPRDEPKAQHPKAQTPTNPPHRRTTGADPVRDAPSEVVRVARVQRQDRDVVVPLIAVHRSAVPRRGDPYPDLSRPPRHPHHDVDRLAHAVRLQRAHPAQHRPWFRPQAPLRQPPRIRERQRPPQPHRDVGQVRGPVVPRHEADPHGPRVQGHVTVKGDVGLRRHRRGNGGGPARHPTENRPQHHSTHARTHRTHRTHTRNPHSYLHRLHPHTTATLTVPCPDVCHHVPHHPTLAAHRVTLAYDGFTALDDVTLSVPRGRITAVVGPNGAGKSTLFHCLAGTLRPDSGRITLGTRDITRLPAHARTRSGMARTFQQLAVFPSLTVGENVRVGADQAGGGRTGAAHDRALRLLALTDLAARPAVDLSTGALRRTELARALAGGPHTLLLDEPAAGLDAAEAAALTTLLRALAADGMALLVVEHDLDLVAGLADTVHVMTAGRIVASGPADRVLEEVR